MLFIYLMSASIIGIIIVIIIDRRKTGNSLLQMLKKLCSIDSVRFENNLKKTQDHSRKVKKQITTFRE